MAATTTRVVVKNVSCLEEYSNVDVRKEAHGRISVFNTFRTERGYGNLLSKATQRQVKAAMFRACREKGIEVSR